MEETECRWCERAWAIGGLLLGAVMVWMSLDLLGVPLTASLSRVKPLAEVIELARGDDDADAS